MEMIKSSYYCQPRIKLKSMPNRLLLESKYLANLFLTYQKVLSKFVYTISVQKIS